MKHLVMLFIAFATFTAGAQDLKSLSKQAGTQSMSMDEGSFIDKFAGDQVKKLTKKLNLSEKQQSQVSDLVVSQLKSDKFQKLIGSFSPTELMGRSAENKISGALKEDDTFKKGMDEILSADQMKMMTSKVEKKG